MSFFAKFYQALLELIQDNWTLIVTSFRILLLVLTLLVSAILGTATLRACSLNWDAII